MAEGPESRVFNKHGWECEEKYRTLLKQNLFEAQVYRELQDHYVLSERQILSEVPLFLDAAAVKEFEYHANMLYSALRKLPEAIFDNDVIKLAEFLVIPELCEELPASYVDLSAPPQFGRPDSILTETGFKFIEQNLFCAIGAYGSVDAANSYFDAHPITSRLRNDVQLSRLSFFDTFAKAYALPNSQGALTILDVEGKEGEQVDCCGVALATALRRRGYPVRWTLLPTASDRLNFQQSGTLISLYSPKIMARKFNDFRPLFDSIRESNVQLLGGLKDLIFWDKQLLAILSDPILGDFVSLEERQSLDRTLPWTRLLRKHKTTYKNETISLVEYVTSNKDSFVIKKGSGTLNQATHLGTRYEASNWASLVRASVAEGCWIVQELVPSIPRNVPYIVSGELKYFSSVPTCSPYMIDGKLADFLVLNFGELDHSTDKQYTRDEGDGPRINVFGPTGVLIVDK